MLAPLEILILHNSTTGLYKNKQTKIITDFYWLLFLQLHLAAQAASRSRALARTLSVWNGLHPRITEGPRSQATPSFTAKMALTSGRRPAALGRWSRTSPSKICPRTRSTSLLWPLKTNRVWDRKWRRTLQWLPRNQPVSYCGMMGNSCLVQFLLLLVRRWCLKETGLEIRNYSCNSFGQILKPGLACGIPICHIITISVAISASPFAWMSGVSTKQRKWHVIIHVFFWPVFKAWGSLWHSNLPYHQLQFPASPFTWISVSRK